MRHSGTVEKGAFQRPFLLNIFRSFDAGFPENLHIAANGFPTPLK
jgi:hypothetical protein